MFAPCRRRPTRGGSTKECRVISSEASNTMSSLKPGASSSEGSDGVDAPPTASMCPRRGVETHFRKASTPSVLYISTTYMSHANLCDFACLIAASPRSCSLDSSKSFSSGLIGTFGTMNQASITMPPLEYAFQRGRMLFRYGCLKSCNSCFPNFPLILLCHKFVLRMLRWQQGHRNNRLAKARANLMRMLASDDATWRSGLIGGSSGLITLG
jgi:hypothetical protein